MDFNPPRFLAAGDLSVQRAHADEVFLLRFEASPQPGSDEFGEVGGAVANCYVDVDGLLAAEQRALEVIDDNGWTAHELKLWKLVRAGEADGLPPRKEEGESGQAELIQEALTNGASCVLYCWPIDAPDADAGG